MKEATRTILITGSTDGVGRRVAERLGRAGCRVLLHGRDAERGATVLATIRDAGGSGQLYRADFASLAGVGALADAIRRDHEALDVLVNNAGIGGGAPGTGRETSVDGHELRFAVNYLSGFLLTRKLLPLLKRGARIVNVSSAGQYEIDFDDPMLTRDYSPARAYRQSKLAQILFTIDLAAELAPMGVTANCLHPATFMDTTMVRAGGNTPISSVDEGADAIQRLIDAPDVGTGQYFNGLKLARANAQAHDEQARAKLRALSVQLTGAA
jgi:NAD(P)-dependent dehydrogenase (short-subunit alcohol dehydrogenase family)